MEKIGYLTKAASVLVTLIIVLCTTLVFCIILQCLQVEMAATTTSAFITGRLLNVHC